MNIPWNERYGSAEYYYGEEPNAFIREQAHHLENCRTIIAFAEGEGRNAIYLARAGHQVTAIDYSENGLNKTEKLAHKYNVRVHTKQANLLTDHIAQQEYDAAIMVFGHFHQREQGLIVNKLKQAVKPGGIIMLEVYSKEQLRYGTGGPPDIDMLYDPAGMLAWCKELEVLHFYYGEQNRVEGKGHTGLAHVIQVIARHRTATI
ncbi:class I SAM-dependent methyltransferase [Paenibacillus alvei]|uniref:Class I SAM-dependent methyltransferase n=1 Tax=Paenibacillus alvei TaxID=44250 RepID=A0ABT4E9A8_PAEAL|nr:class I SAM-dependent methyltransferase [Paenibacillus alvei]MCY9530312.1 class I SAM-dependent methyltransferase [Paenibacillus alvei]